MVDASGSLSGTDAALEALAEYYTRAVAFRSHAGPIIRNDPIDSIITVSPGKNANRGGR